MIITIVVAGPVRADSFKQKHFDPVIEKATDGTSLKIVLAAGLSTALTRPYDDDIRATYKNHQKMTESQAHSGDLLGSGVTGVVALGAQYFFDDNENHYQSHARTLVYSTLVNFAFKSAFSRPRPNENDRYSFPSGHTTTSFATATSLTYAYGWKAAIIAYPVAAFVGLSRLSDDAHWGSDVVAGAFLGVFMARSCFYKLDDKDKIAGEIRQIEYFPIIEPGKSGLGLVYVF